MQQQSATQKPIGSAQAQASLWGPRARDWADTQEPQSAPLFEAVFRATGVEPGVPLLDAGCASGFAAARAAELGAAVSGVDATPALIAIARERVPSARFEIADLEDLPFADGSFAIVTGFNSFQYAADPGRALAEARRVCRRGGRVAIATWGQPERCQAAAYLAALKNFLPPLADTKASTAERAPQGAKSAAEKP